MSEIVLKSAQFRREREARWRELEALVGRVEKHGVRALDAEQLHALPVLYRAAISSLSVARSISLDQNVVEYLEGLATRAYSCVYSPRRRARAVIVEFFARSFPQAVRALRVWMLFSFFLFAVGGFTGFGMTKSEIDHYHLFVDADLANGRDPTAETEELLDVIFNRESEHEQDALSAFATFLFAHNAQIGLLCFAVGIVPLLLVGLLLFQNGAMLGAFAALHDHHDIGVEFGSWVLPHGVTELLAVVLCGGAGLAVGMATVFPGRRTRLESLVRSGRLAGTVVIGCVSMFFIAALIEGFFRQLVNDVAIRYAVVAVTAAFWSWYFLRAGRQQVRA
jgi:uncharacterized membrane protein SpoIIM required for sporulation